MMQRKKARIDEEIKEITMDYEALKEKSRLIDGMRLFIYLIG